MNFEAVFGFFIGAIIGGLLTGLTVRCEVSQSWKMDAVAVGAAEFYMDKDGQRNWRWKGQEK